MKKTKFTKFEYYDKRVQEIEADLWMLEDMKGPENHENVCVIIDKLKAELAEIHELCDRILLCDEEDEVIWEQTQ